MYNTIRVRELTLVGKIGILVIANRYLAIKLHLINDSISLIAQYQYYYVFHLVYLNNLLIRQEVIRNSCRKDIVSRQVL